VGALNDATTFNSPPVVQYTQNTSVGNNAFSNKSAATTACTLVGATPTDPLAVVGVTGTSHTCVGWNAAADQGVAMVQIGAETSSSSASNIIQLGRPGTTAALRCPLRSYVTANGSANLVSLPENALFCQREKQVFVWTFPYRTVQNQPDNRIFTKVQPTLPQTIIVPPFSLESTTLPPSYAALRKNLFWFQSSHTNASIVIPAFVVNNAPSVTIVVYETSTPPAPQDYLIPLPYQNLPPETALPAYTVMLGEYTAPLFPLNDMVQTFPSSTTFSVNVGTGYAVDLVLTILVPAVENVTMDTEFSITLTQQTGV
jgi:hypothetical protein